MEELPVGPGPGATTAVLPEAPPEADPAPTSGSVNVPAPDVAPNASVVEAAVYPAAASTPGGYTALPHSSPAAASMPAMTQARGGLGPRLLLALEGPNAAQEIEESLMKELAQTKSLKELFDLIMLCSVNQQLLRRRYCSKLGAFCLSAIAQLGRAAPDAWPTNRIWAAATNSLRLVEGVCLICATSPEDRLTLCHALQAILKLKFLPRQAQNRLESAIMSLGDQAVRNLLAPVSIPSPDLEETLKLLAASMKPSAIEEARRQKVFELFDAVIFRRFKVHGRAFGSGVNGFELSASDIDISVLLPQEVQAQLIADSQRQLAEVRAGLEASELEALAATGSIEEALGFGFLVRARPVRAACVAAVRALAVELRAAGLHVVDVVEGARVPIIKCRHRIDDKDDVVEPAGGWGGDKPEQPDFEIDISFCNEVASYNSRLLRAYADFDSRLVAVCRLVKHWAKRRKINSPFDGTLSSYAYSLMVIHYFQNQRALPNLQRPRAEVLKHLGYETPPQRILEGGHNVWFASPADVRPPPSVVGKEPRPDGALPLAPEEVRWWLGHDKQNRTVSDLLYGFFRYFALEFNLYSDVVSIRLGSDPPTARISKMEYFMSAAEEGEAAEMEEEEEQGCHLTGHKLDKLLSCSNLVSCAKCTQVATLSCRACDYFLCSDCVGEDDALTEEATAEAWSSPYVGPAESTHNGKGGPWPGPGSEDIETLQLTEGAALPEAAVAAASAEGDEGAAGDEEAAGARRSSGSEGGGGSSSKPSRGETLHLGTVQSFNSENGFGFIACDATFAKYRRDVFLHQRQAAGTQVGDHVSFLVELNGKGQPQARQVRKVEAEEMEQLRGEQLRRPSGQGEAGPQATAGTGEAPSTPGLRPSTPEGPQGGSGGAAAGAVPATSSSSSGRASEDCSRFALIAQRRMKDRQCLCLDDPMERHRTLGTTFAGQESLSQELRRAVSILKRGGTSALDELFREKDASSSSKRPWDRREYSPIPEQSAGAPAFEGGPKTTIVEVKKKIKKELTGRLIGTSGTTIQNIRIGSGVEEARVRDDQRGGDGTLSLKGTPSNVKRALDLVEEVLNNSRSRSSRGALPKDHLSDTGGPGGASASRRGYPEPVAGGLDGLLAPRAGRGPRGDSYYPRGRAASGGCGMSLALGGNGGGGASSSSAAPPAAGAAASADPAHYGSAADPVFARCTTPGDAKAAGLAGLLATTPPPSPSGGLAAGVALDAPQGRNSAAAGAIGSGRQHVDASRSNHQPPPPWVSTPSVLHPLAISGSPPPGGSLPSSAGQARDGSYFSSSPGQSRSQGGGGRDAVQPGFLEFGAPGIVRSCDELEASLRRGSPPARGDKVSDKVRQQPIVVSHLVPGMHVPGVSEGTPGVLSCTDLEALLTSARATAANDHNHHGPGAIGRHLPTEGASHGGPSQAREYKNGGLTEAERRADARSFLACTAGDGEDRWSPRAEGRHGLLVNGGTGLGAAAALGLDAGEGGGGGEKPKKSKSNKIRFQ